MRLMRETSKDGEAFKFTPFEHGLKDSVDWFVKNHHQARTGKVKHGQFKVKPGQFKVKFDRFKVNRNHHNT